ncbi:MAG: hypothetical protein AAF763_14950 [Pseudomonadota bacterium]
MSDAFTIERVSRVIPTIPAAHWLIRLPLAGIIMYQGFSKVPLAASDAAAFGVPVLLWVLAALGEITSGAALIAGGVLKDGRGELLTRIGGLMIAAIVASVIAVVYWAPLWDILSYNQFHVLLLAGGIYFALRGNDA